MKLVNPLTRRSLLRTLAVGAGMAPMASSLGRSFLSNAHAAEGGAPRRIIFFDNGLGLPGNSRDAPDGKNGIQDEWFIKPASTYADCKFGYLLQPLEKFRNDMVVLQHLQGRGAGSHSNANTQILTGSPEGVSHTSQSVSQNASIDWQLSETVGKATTPRFPMVMPGIVSPGQTHTYTPAGSRLYHNDNPYDLYKRLFSDLIDPGSDSKLLARLAHRKSVLDYVAKDIVAYQAKLGKDDRARADVQLDAIRTMERRLSAGVTMADPSRPVGTCKGPALATPQLDWKFPNSRNVPQLMRMVHDISIAALACDLTRVVTIMNFAGEHHDGTSNFDPVNVPQGWHSLSHSDPNVESYRKAKMFVSGMLAELVEKLRAIPEGNGSMLDNTVVFMVAEMGYNHEVNGLPEVLIGGKNLGIKTGQYIRTGEAQSGKGMPINRLLVSLLKAMGVPGDSWGIQDPGKGPVPGLFRG